MHRVATEGMTPGEPSGLLVLFASVLGQDQASVQD